MTVSPTARHSLLGPRDLPPDLTLPVRGPYRLTEDNHDYYWDFDLQVGGPARTHPPPGLKPLQPPPACRSRRRIHRCLRCPPPPSIAQCKVSFRAAAGTLISRLLTVALHRPLQRPVDEHHSPCSYMECPPS